MNAVLGNNMHAPSMPHSMIKSVVVVAEAAVAMAGNCHIWHLHENEDKIQVKTMALCCGTNLVRWQELK